MRHPMESCFSVSTETEIAGLETTLCARMALAAACFALLALAALAQLGDAACIDPPTDTMPFCENINYKVLPSSDFERDMQASASAVAGPPVGPFRCVLRAAAALVMPRNEHGLNWLRSPSFRGLRRYCLFVCI